MGEYYKFPFKALKYLLDEGIYTRVAAMTDSKVMLREEREILIQMLDKIDPRVNYAESLEEEVIDAYDTTVKIIKAYKDKGYCANAIALK